MRKLIFVLFLLQGLSMVSFAQGLPSCENVTAFKKSRTPDLGIVLYSNDPETLWNALRLAIYSQTKGDSVVVFVLGKAMDVYMNDTSKFNIKSMSIQFLTKGGDIYACASCAKLRNTENVQYCTITSVADLYAIIKRSKQVLTF